VFAGKPIIGIAGGIGSGKSAVAKMFGEMGCLVIDADELVTQAYRDPTVLAQLRQWGGDEIFHSNGAVNRQAIAARIFTDPGRRQQLESMLHPWVLNRRDELMAKSADQPQIVAFVWDTPLLFEAGLQGRCDAVVFVDAPFELRLARVGRSRGWDRAQLQTRENLQWPLDKKRKISDHIVVNTADAEYIRGQVREVLFRILARRLPAET
jgi:dephospho-CoA kinase